MDLGKGHEGVVALYRPTPTNPASPANAAPQTAGTGTESLLTHSALARAAQHPYPNASRGRAALTADGEHLCGGSYRDGRYTVSVADMRSCRLPSVHAQEETLLIDLLEQRYDAPTAAAIAARYPPLVHSADLLYQEIGRADNTPLHAMLRRGVSGREEEERRDEARKRVIHVDAHAPVTCVGAHPERLFVLAGTIGNRLLVVSHKHTS